MLPHLQTQIRTRSGAYTVYYTVKIPKADKSRWYDLNPQEDELSEVRLCGALAGELGHAHGRGRWTHHFHLPPTAYHIVWDFEHGTFSSFRMISSYQRIIKSFFPLIIRVCTMLLPNLNPRGHQPPQWDLKLTKGILGTTSPTVIWMRFWKFFKQAFFLNILLGLHIFAWLKHFVDQFLAMTDFLMMLALSS